MTNPTAPSPPVEPTQDAIKAAAAAMRHKSGSIWADAEDYALVALRAALTSRPAPSEAMREQCISQIEIIAKLRADLERLKIGQAVIAKQAGFYKPDTPDFVFVDVPLGILRRALRCDPPPYPEDGKTDDFSKRNDPFAPSADSAHMFECPDCGKDIADMTTRHASNCPRAPSAEVAGERDFQTMLARIIYRFDKGLSINDTIRTAKDLLQREGSLSPLRELYGWNRATTPPAEPTGLDRLREPDARDVEIGRLRSIIQDACDLLAERTHGNQARSPGHNARLCLEAAIRAEATK